MRTSPPRLLAAARRPRVEHWPEGIVDRSLVSLTRDLSEMAGLSPDPWQGDSHEMMLGLRDDGKFAAATFAEWVGRQQGKTGGIGVPRVLCGLCLLPERRFLWSSHEQRTSTEAFEIIREALLTLGDEVKPELIRIPPLDLPGALREPLFVQVISANGKEGFRTWTTDRRLAWRKRVLMVSRSKGGGRGFAADVRVIDEAYAYTPEQQSALAPTRLAKPYAQTIYLSSPPLKGDEGKVMYRLRERAEEENDPTIGYRDWGLAVALDDFLKMSRADQRAFLYNREHWYATLPALGLGRVTEESVEELIKEFAEFSDAARELLGLWPIRITDDGGRWAVIAEKPWKGQGGADPEAWGERAAFAIAAPEAQDWAAIDVAGYARDSNEILVQVVRYARGTDWVIEEALGLARRNPGAVWAIDPRGPAGHLIAPLERAAEKFKVPMEIVEPSQLEVAHGVQRFIRGVVDTPVIRHFDQEELDIAVKVADTRLIGDVRTWLRRGGTDISPLDAGSLAVWAAEDCAGGGTPMAVPAARDAVIGTGDLMGVGF